MMPGCWTPLSGWLLSSPGMGIPEPIYIEDSDTRFAIGWNGHYHADGEAFVYSDRRDRSRYHDSRLPNAQDRSTGVSRKFQISLARTSPKFQGATGSKALI